MFGIVLACNAIIIIIIKLIKQFGTTDPVCYLNLIYAGYFSFGILFMYSFSFSLNSTEIGTWFIFQFLMHKSL